MINAYNLNSDSEVLFTHDCPINAVTYCHAEENDMLSFWFSLNRDAEKIKENFPLTFGERTICCGDWCTMAFD